MSVSKDATARSDGNTATPLPRTRTSGFAPCFSGEFNRSMQHEPRMEVSWCTVFARA